MWELSREGMPDTHVAVSTGSICFTFYEHSDTLITRGEAATDAVAKDTSLL